MPDHNPYGEALPSSDPVVRTAERVVRVSDRGTDPRPVIVATLRVLHSWGEAEYEQIADDIELMHPDDPECALCGYLDCQPSCPMMRWRGQA